LGEYHKKVSDNDYWGNTPLIVINHGLAKSGVDIDINEKKGPDWPSSV
jgi:hypothetical protein